MALATSSIVFQMKQASLQRQIEFERAARLAHQAASVTDEVLPSGIDDLTPVKGAEKPASGFMAFFATLFSRRQPAMR